MTDKVQVKCRYTTITNLDDIKPNPRNPIRHPEFQVERLAEVIRLAGWRQPIIISDLSGMVVKGHCRLEAAKRLGLKTAPVEIQHYADRETEMADLLADNHIAELAEMDNEQLGGLLEELQHAGSDYLAMSGFTPEDLEQPATEEKEADQRETEQAPENATPIDTTLDELRRQFLYPPSSVFYSYRGEWKRRKMAWISIGMKSEEGRKAKMTYHNSPGYIENKNKLMKKLGRQLTSEEIKHLEDNIEHVSSTSVFDPVLCELALTWFSKRGDTVIDPFAGGSVRGIVSNFLGRKYTGIDLRPEQVEANRAQAADILAEGNQPTWLIGDSSEVLPGIKQQFDFGLSCPPYADLEQYSDDPKDLSNMDYEDFSRVYRTIIAALYDRMKDDTFVVWVVGEVRDKNGIYYNFVGDTISAFTSAGFSYYNEMVLINPAGSASFRASRAFEATRKVAKQHQNVLVFCKGNPRKATQKCGKVEVGTFEDAENNGE